MASPASHTHSHTLTLTLSAPTATFHIVCFVSFRSVWFSVVLCFVLDLFCSSREGEIRRFKRHWKGSLFKKRTRAALLAIMAIMICVLSAAPAPTSTSLSL